MSLTIPNPLLYQLAMQHHQAGRLAEAEQLYRQVLAQTPGHPDALHLLGVIAYQVGQGEESLRLIKLALQLRPNEGFYYVNLGNTFSLLGRHEDAVAAYRSALALNPQSPPAWNNLGTALNSLGRAVEAIEAYQRALQLDPNYVDALSNITVPLCDQRRYEEAVVLGRRALALAPQLAEISLNLGNALWGRGEAQEAVAAFRRAIALRPDLALAHSNVSGPLLALGLPVEAEQHCRRALELQPNFALAQNNLGNSLEAQGRVDEALESLAKARLLEPGSVAMHSNYLAVLHYSTCSTPQAIRAAHEEYERLQGTPRRAYWAPHEVTRNPERRLRLGFVSPKFCGHPVGRFLVRLLEALPREEFEMICYSDTTRTDAMTERIRAQTALWRETLGLTEERVATQIREDRIDILFDLAGHTAENRLPVFARKPAPIQITWMDYVGTTGLAAMDYLLANEEQIPTGSETHYCEKILRLPADYICYDPPAEAPEPGPLPALARGGITFANFSVLSKLTPEMLALWAEILRRVPDSRLVLKNRCYSEPATQARLRSLLPGVAPERVEFRGWSRPVEVMATYREIDLALDTIPYNGGLTVCEALWMGVPVITCPGQTFASRHGLSHLTAAGFTESIAANPSEYVEKAVAWAGDLPRLAATRARLRDQVAASSLCDGPRFAAHFTRAIREVWRNWVTA